MKFKSILLTAAATISIATATMAQVPNYVPTNGLAGWWPFNGNANDESGNENNGTVNGAALSTDRFGNVNSAFNFNNESRIKINYSSSLNSPTGTISGWIYVNAFPPSNDPQDIIFGKGWGYPQLVIRDNGKIILAIMNSVSSSTVIESNTTLTTGIWYHIIAYYSSSNFSLYVNGVIDNGITPSPLPSYFSFCNSEYWIGGFNHQGSCMPSDNQQNFNGKIDDLGFWNRELTPQEITYLYNATNCSNNTIITPPTNSIATGSNASFTATTFDTDPSYEWQSDFGQGFQTLNNFGNYSGANSATLNIANVQLSEHNQPIRVISTSGNCIDTSNVALINVLDTCITSITIYDTLLTTVTDTLVINATITGINPPNNLNALRVFPNPANTHITIDYGNFNAMTGYTLQIVNAVGQTVFTTPIDQQTSYIDLSTWTGSGIYFVQLIDPQSNTIENRKIVIQ
jgi:hypothetical protein